MIARIPIRAVLTIAALLLPPVAAPPLEAQESTLGALGTGLASITSDDPGKIRMWTPPGVSPPRTR